MLQVGTVVHVKREIAFRGGDVIGPVYTEHQSPRTGVIAGYTVKRAGRFVQKKPPKDAKFLHEILTDRQVFKVRDTYKVYIIKYALWAKDVYAEEDDLIVLYRPKYFVTEGDFQREVYFLLPRQNKTRGKREDL